MAQTESKIKLIFEGAERGVVAAAAKAKAAVKSVSDENGKAAKATRAATDAEAARVKTLKELSSGLGTAGKWMGLFGAATGVGAAAIGAALPAIGSLGLGFGVVALAMKANNAESKAYKAQLEAMKKPLQDLQNTAGKAFLPGVTKFLKDSTTLFPILDGAVARTGKILGDTASKLGDLFKTDKFKSDLDKFLRATEPITSAIGDSFVKLTGKLVEFGAKMAPAGEGFATFFRGLVDGLSGLLDELTPHAADLKSIFESLGSILKTVLPIVGKLAGDLAGRLAPILRDVAGFVDRNKDAISAWVPWIGQAVVALAGLKIATTAAGWVSALTGAFAKLAGAGPAAETAGKGAGIAWGRGLVGGLALAGAGIGGTIILDKILPRDAAVTHGSQIARDMLHEMATVFQGGGSAFKTLDVAQWISNPISMAVEVGKRKLLELFGVANSKIPPITFDANTGPAQGQVATFLNQVKGTSGEVNINGRTVDAGQALAEIVQRINSGNGTVTVNGRTVPASDALRDIIDQINAGAGTVTVNGQTIPAGQALADFLGRTNRSSATTTVNANTSAAQGVVDGFIRRNDGRQIRIFTSVLGAGGIASAGRLATGGPVQGPGTGTSDTAGLFALSSGEYVATAKQVDAAGGPQAFGRLMRALERGPRAMAAGGSVMRASARAAMRTPAPASSSGSGSGTFQLVVGPGADAAAAAFIASLVRTGKLQLKAA